MIICYSGTGNSLTVARQLSHELGDEIVSLEGESLIHPENLSLDCKDQTRLIWVFPVYSWGVPPVLKRVIEKITLNYSEGLSHYMVVTCGDDAGLTHRQWRRLLRRRNWAALTAFTVQMPNTYTLMKGFDVDAPDVAQAKLDAMPSRVATIAQAIAQRSGKDSVVTGHWPWLKSWIVYPWFVRHAMSPAPFHHTDACVGCSLCAKNCPMHNIDMRDNRPEWHDNCALCLRCYHLCPHHAVAYGKATLSKGQYHHPDQKRDTM